MLLQPLVENAVCHGIEPKKEGGSVLTGARKERDAPFFAYCERMMVWESRKKN